MGKAGKSTRLLPPRREGFPPVQNTLCVAIQNTSCPLLKDSGLHTTSCPLLKDSGLHTEPAKYRPYVQSHTRHQYNAPQQDSRHYTCLTAERSLSHCKVSDQHCSNIYLCSAPLTALLSHGQQIRQQHQLSCRPSSTSAFSANRRQLTTTMNRSATTSTVATLVHSTKSLQYYVLHTD